MPSLSSTRAGGRPQGRGKCASRRATSTDSHVTRDRQDCFRKVKISRALEPFLASGGGVVVEFGEGEGVGDDVGEEGWGVEVPP